MTGLSRTTIYRMGELGSFPPRVTLGPKMVAWRGEEVDAWLRAKSQTDERPEWKPPTVAPWERDQRPNARMDTKPLEGRKVPTKNAARGAVALHDVTPPPDDDVGPRPPDWPQMMRLRTAAAYLDLSEKGFQAEIERGLLPKPVMLGGKPHWSRHRIDCAIATLLAWSDEGRHN